MMLLNVFSERKDGNSQKAWRYVETVRFSGSVRDYHVREDIEALRR